MGLGWHSPANASNKDACKQTNETLLELVATLSRRLEELTAAQSSGLEGHYVVVLDEYVPSHIIVLDCDPYVPNNAIMDADANYVVDEQGNYVTYTF